MSKTIKVKAKLKIYGEHQAPYFEIKYKEGLFYKRGRGMKIEHPRNNYCWWDSWTKQDFVSALKVLTMEELEEMIIKHLKNIFIETKNENSLQEEYDKVNEKFKNIKFKVKL